MGACAFSLVTISSCLPESIGSSNFFFSTYKASNFLGSGRFDLGFLKVGLTLNAVEFGSYYQFLSYGGFARAPAQKLSSSNVTIE